MPFTKVRVTKKPEIKPRREVKGISEFPGQKLSSRSESRVQLREVPFTKAQSALQSRPVLRLCLDGHPGNPFLFLLPEGDAFLISLSSSNLHSQY